MDRPEEIDVHQVFRRFYKADAARTHTSTGLGLAIAQGLSLIHIWVKSQLRRYLQLGGGVVKPTLLQAGGIALDDRTKSCLLYTSRCV